MFEAKSSITSHYQIMLRCLAFNLIWQLAWNIPWIKISIIAFYFQSSWCLFSLLQAIFFKWIEKSWVSNKNFDWKQKKSY